MKKQRKHINLSRITAFILSVAMLAGFCPQGVSLADIPVTLPKVNAAENIRNPRIVKDSSMDAGQKVTWDCVYFGSYPQSEVTSKDGSIYNALKNATDWDENNDITIGGTKYRRLRGKMRHIMLPVILLPIITGMTVIKLIIILNTNQSNGVF